MYEFEQADLPPRRRSLYMKAFTAPHSFLDWLSQPWAKNWWDFFAAWYSYERARRSLVVGLCSRRIEDVLRRKGTARLFEIKFQGCLISRRSKTQPSKPRSENWRWRHRHM